MKINEMPTCSKAQTKVIWGEYTRTVDAIHAAIVAMSRIRPTADEYGENYQRAGEKWSGQAMMLDALYGELSHTTLMLRHIWQKEQPHDT